MRLGPPPRITALVASVGSDFAFRRGARLVGRIHIGRQRRELGGAGVDALVDRAYAQFPAPGHHLARGDARELTQALVRKAQHLPFQHVGGDGARALAGDLPLHRHQVGDALQEPRVHLAGGVDGARVQADAVGLGDDQDAVGPEFAERGGDFIGADIHMIEPRQPRLQGAQALVQGFAEVAADGHGLAHRLHGGGEQGPRRRGTSRR